MSNHEMYHKGSRQLQDRFDSRRIADRVQQVVVHSTFNEDDCKFIENCRMFFLATADEQGCPDCSYKGGLPGFVRILDERTLGFPNYDGNGMFRSLGNILVNPQVGLLFIDFESSGRLRLNGIASIHYDDFLLSEFHGAQLVVKVAVEQIFRNCPRYIHKMRLVEDSVYAPKPNYTPPVPNWKQEEVFRDYLPRENDQ